MNYSHTHHNCPASAIFRHKRNNRGFTLIELLIVVSIIGILAAIAVPNYQWGIIRAKEAVLRETLYNFNSILDQYYADKGKYPESLTDLTKPPAYMRVIPKDPFTGTDDWVYTPPPPTTGTDTSAPNLTEIPTVHSASDKVSPVTNTPYKDW